MPPYRVIIMISLYEKNIFTIWKTSFHYMKIPIICQYVIFSLYKKLFFHIVNLVFIYWIQFSYSESSFQEMCFWTQKKSGAFGAGWIFTIWKLWFHYMKNRRSAFGRFFQIHHTGTSRYVTGKKHCCRVLSPPPRPAGPVAGLPLLGMRP